MGKGQYHKYYFLNNRLCGVILLGDLTDMARLTMALEKALLIKRSWKGEDVKLHLKNKILIGITLFSMFLGGNLIFPPFLGNMAGRSIVPAFLGFALSAVCLPVLGVIAVTKIRWVRSSCFQGILYFPRYTYCFYIWRSALALQSPGRQVRRFRWRFRLSFQEEI